MGAPAPGIATRTVAPSPGMARVICATNLRKGSAMTVPDAQSLSILRRFENQLELLEYNAKCLQERLEELEKKLEERDSNAKNLALAVADRIVEKSNEVSSL